MKYFLFIIAILSFINVTAQNKLSTSRKSSYYTYAYAINKQEAAMLYKHGIDKVDEKYLSNLVTSFASNSEELPHLKNGNYLFVHTNQNKLVYELQSIGDLKCRLINNYRDLAIMLYTKQGEIVKNAIVYFNKQIISFDIATQSYKLNKEAAEGALSIEYNNTIYYFPVKSDNYNKRNKHHNFWYTITHAFPLKYFFAKKEEKYRNYYSRSFFDYKNEYEQKHSGFLVFNKPMYKPKDTVKLKAFVLDKKGNGISKNLLLRLSNEDFDIDTIIAKLSPYRNGGYEYSFVLNDSLDLDLDDTYLITLEEEGLTPKPKRNKDDDDDDDEKELIAARRKVVMRNKFKYEEYELQTVTFTARTNIKKHYRGEAVSIFAKAKDENDLPIMDGRIQIIITNDGNEIFNAPTVFLPDTLWNYSQPLDNVGETKINIPDSIFPAASFNYDIQCVFLNSNNERKSQNLHQTLTNQKEKIVFEQIKDSLKINYTVAGKDTSSIAKVYVFNKSSDTLETQLYKLPTTIKLNYFANEYEVEMGEVTNTFSPSADNLMVDVNTTRTKDSVKIQLNNPYHLPIWYTIFCENKVIQTGCNNNLVFAQKTNSPKNYSIAVQYFFADQIHSQEYTIPYFDKALKINVDQPLTVYPGQTTDINISVSNADGKPMSDADVTAYAFTKKFNEYNKPTIPYLGKIYPNRKKKSYFSINQDQTFTHASILNWQRWSKEMGLDSMEYYKFLYPLTRYVLQEKIKDSITQIAPFIVNNGTIEPIHLLYIDERPVFFSQAQQLKRYSFEVTPGKHALAMRTAKHLVMADSIYAAPGIKTFMSFNLDSSNNTIRFKKVNDTLNSYEADLWNKHMILVNNNFYEDFTYIKQKEKNYLLNYNENNYSQYNRNSLLLGPLSSTEAEFISKNKFTQAFDVEPNYSYTITKGLVKQKSTQNNYLFNRVLDNRIEPSFSDYVLTSKEIDSLWKNFTNEQWSRKVYFKNTYYSKQDNGLLQIGFNRIELEKLKTIKAIFLFNHDDYEFLHVHKGNERNFEYLPVGNYRLFILFNNNGYFLKNTLHIQKNGINYYAIDNLILHQKDSMSIRVANIINDFDKKNYIDTKNLTTLQETFNERFFDNAQLIKQISGRVIDYKSNPIPFATVQIKGTKINTATDQNGYFALRVPNQGKIIFSAIGFATIEKNITDDFKVIILISDASALNEVVVTGYETQTKRQVSASATVSYEQVLSGKASGVQIQVRGVSSISSSSSPLIVIDGVPFTGTIEDLDPVSVTNTSIIKDAAAIALYGSRAANGVIFINTNQLKNPNNKQNIDIDNNIGVGDIGNRLRTNFRDDAYWQPKLKTNAEGKASFKTTFPDDITSWRTFAIAITDQKQTGFTNGFIRSFKPISANLTTPQFAIQGDNINIIGKLLNYTSDSIQLKKTFSFNNNLIKEQTIGLRNSIIDTLNITAGNTDSLKFKYTIERSDHYFDGEERSIPVFLPGVVETNGFFSVLDKDSSFTIPLNSADGPIKVSAEASLMPAMLDEIDNIKQYEHFCNEQLSSKLKALLIKKKIYSFLKKEFKEEANISDIITRLNKSKTQNLWGWWVNNAPSSWISLHVVEAFLMAEKNGYTVNLNKQAVIDNIIFNWENDRQSNQLFSLKILHALNAKADYKKYIDTLEKRLKEPTLFQKLQLVELKQKLGLPYVIDTFLNKATHTMFGNMYWGEDSYRFFDNDIQSTLTMYRILKNTGKYTEELKRIRYYFLEKRKNGRWRNTYESALILENILPDLLVNDNVNTPVTITIAGNETITEKSFPFIKTYTGNQNITVTKKGSLPVYFTAYQQRWEKNPTQVSKGFEVQTKLERKGQTITALKAGEPISLKTSVNVLADADYIMVEIPIPAGCSYQEKNQGYSNNEVHREYFKNKVSIFCSTLKKGKYEFSFTLQPRYTGSYHLNPAKAEMMYFPVFYGRESMKEVSIF